MPGTQIEERPTLGQEDAILAWRLWVLARAGYDAECAAVLAATNGVDLHAAVELAERGRPGSTALRILL